MFSFSLSHVFENVTAGGAMLYDTNDSYIMLRCACSPAPVNQTLVHADFHLNGTVIFPGINQTCVLNANLHTKDNDPPEIKLLKKAVRDEKVRPLLDSPSLSSLSSSSESLWVSSDMVKHGTIHRSDVVFIYNVKQRSSDFHQSSSRGCFQANLLRGFRDMSSLTSK